MNALDLLSGDAQTFLAKVWASRVHLHRTEPDELVGLLSLDDADALLTDTAIRTPAVRVAKDGAVLAESSYTRHATIAGKQLTGLVDPRRALELFADGATIVLQGLHRYHPPLTRLVAELELALGHPCQANAYLTPPGAQGFAVHSDSHDVFVFQTAGSKQWEIHGADGAEEVLLEPGLSMYLPAGTPHAARAQETVSLHVTIGINQLTWRGLVERTVSPLLAGVDGGHLPAGYLDDPALLRDGLAERLETLAAEVRRLDTAAAVGAEIRRFLTSRPPRLSGGLQDVLSAGSVEVTTRLRRRPGHPCVLLDRGEQVEVLLGDRAMTGPARIRPALEELRLRAELTPADLPLDPESSVVLCRRLVREGLLEIV
ncbi:Ribosomal protein L16 Arg81 hydroxylase, contains JmjC domain [Nocardioides terrae]|uniref:Ribosomal protein L16 Arg81 hydroxylase, contains JmjC domain n=1 Tax=Nocardioides terrae TaxID=574651 RepID=A0A1I1DFL3_9ACTN|nr:cupin domain-containing protein [Nocardioides terrae]SFB73731.1 Ribosomal protein L16 Arg81 hydroxylase, contains JmjC domain [Nocardioides terrae]